MVARHPAAPRSPATRQKLVRYLGAGACRRFADRRGSGLAPGRAGWLLPAIALLLLLFILLGIWQETKMPTGAMAGEPRPAFAGP